METNNVNNMMNSFGGRADGTVSGLNLPGATASVGGGGMLGIILAGIGGGVAQGGMSMINDYLNRQEARRQQAEAREMAERQFAWGQNMDRFSMGMMNRQQGEAEMMNRQKISQDRIDRLNELLRTNVELQNHVRAMYGRK